MKKKHGQAQKRRAKKAEKHRVSRQRKGTGTSSASQRASKRQELKVAVENGDWTSASWILEEELERDPKNTTVRRHLAEVLMYQGGVCLPEALEHAQRAVADKPNIEGWTLLATIHGKMEQREQQMAAAEEALKINPDHPQLIRNVATMLIKMGVVDRALSLAQLALERKPKHYLSWGTWVEVLRGVGRYDEAMQAVREMLRLKPDSAEAHIVYGELLLEEGKFAEGWLEWERGHVANDLSKTVAKTARKRIWDGTPRPDDELVVWLDGGAGDHFQMLRYLPLAEKRVGRVRVICPEDEASLIESCFGVETGTKHDFNDEECWWIRALSLPRFFTPDEAAIPPAPYLTADSSLKTFWQKRLATQPGLKVGLTWGSGLKSHFGASRSCPLAEYAPLAQVPGVTYYSLQKGPHAKDTPPPGLILHDLGSDLGDWSETAAAMAALDLIISVDTGPVHLAGALGRPTWLLLRFTGDWRWQRDREDSPWYPSMRLFRQPQWGDWQSVMERVAHELRALQEQHQQAA